jgi:LacI family transcriptional regulator
MRVTIKDIALKAGLSVSTVSLVLNNKPSRLSQKTKKKVLQIAKEMSYTPNLIAVSLKSMRTKTIGLIVPDIRNDFYSTLAKGLEDICMDNAWNVILCNSNARHERELEYIEILYSKGVEGIVLAMTSPESVEGVKSSVEISKNIPLVLLDLSLVNSKINAVTMNHEKGGYMATHYLLTQGHRKIGCITGPQYLEGSYSRLSGYKRALSEYNIDVDKSLICTGDYTYDSGTRAVETLLKKDITAIFAFNDMMAYGVFNGLSNHGISVPDDISVIGYDDILFSKFVRPQLTTIHQPIYEMGRRAGEILVGITNGDLIPPVISEFEPHLVLRQSVKLLK